MENVGSSLRELRGNWCGRSGAVVIEMNKSSSSNYNGKKGKFTLEQAMKARRGNRGIAVLFL